MPRCCGKSGAQKLAIGSHKRGSFRLDLSVEIWVRLDEFERQVKLMLVDMSESDARLRTSVLLPPESGISFRWVGPSREAVIIHGHVADVKMIDKKTAEYTIDFSVPLAVRDQLARELRELDRRKNLKPVDQPVELLTEDDAVGITKRKAYRALVQFPVSVKAARRGRVQTIAGEARDLSVSGMMVMLADDVQEGSEIELTFNLPSDRHAAPEVKEVVEMSPFGERRVRKPAAAPTSDVIQLQARVLKKLGNARNGSPLYGVSFFEVPGYFHEQIARWIHSHQLRQLSTSPRGVSRETLKHATRAIALAVSAHRPRSSRAAFVRPDPGRRFLAAELARKREYVEIPKHHVTLVATPGGDVFGLGTPPQESKKSNVRSLPVREAYVVGDQDVFGLGVRSEAS